jgi:hypothetical protein
MNLGRWTDEGVRPYMDIALASEISSRYLTGRERRFGMTKSNDKSLGRTDEGVRPSMFILSEATDEGVRRYVSLAVGELF